MALRGVDRPDRSIQRAPALSTRWRVVSVVEIVLATAVVLRDLLIPALVLLAMTVVSLILRRQGPGTLGLRGGSRPARMAAQVFVLSVFWSVLTLALFLPVLEHLTGQRQDVSQFAPLKGNLALLLLLLLASWTLGAFGEELAFRGYLQTRMREVLRAGTGGLILAVLLSSVLFGLAHTEQGLIGIVVVTLDGAFFSVLRYRYQTLWAAVLAHGFNNTIGVVAYFIAGPFYGLW